MKGLESTLNKFILSLEFYDDDGRKKIATSEHTATFMQLERKMHGSSAAAGTKGSCGPPGGGGKSAKMSPAADKQQQQQQQPASRGKWAA